MRTHSYRHLSAEERETLSLGLPHGYSFRTMAQILGRVPSTLSREVSWARKSGHLGGTDDAPGAAGPQGRHGCRQCVRGFTKKLRHVPAPLRTTLTYDRGKEMADHEPLAHRLAIQVFLADPHSPWQRRTNENTNGLLRQYLPKGSDLSGYTQRELTAIAHRLNTRPRKCFAFATPLEVSAQLRHHSPVALGT